MSEPVKTNSDVLKEVPVESSQVDSSAFDNATSGEESTPAIIDAPAAEKTVDFNDFQRVIDGNGNETTVPIKPAPEVKQDTVPVVPKTEPLQVKPAQTQQQDNSQTNVRAAGARDYSGFTDDEVKALKHMGGPAFAFVAPKLKQMKELGKVLTDKDNEIAQLKTGKQMLPDNYFEHPQAYVLTKEFNDSARELNTASQIQQHWQQQLANIRRGEPWFDLDMDAKGNLIKSAGKVSDADAEAQVFTYLHGAVNQTSELQRKVAGIEANFKERHKGATDKLDKAYKDNFAVYDDPKHPYSKTMQTIYSEIPSEFRGNPLAKISAGAATAALHYMQLFNAAKAELDELKAGKGVTTTTASRQAQAGPTKDSVVANGGGGKQESTLGTKMEDFIMD